MTNVWWNGWDALGQRSFENLIESRKVKKEASLSE